MDYKLQLPSALDYFSTLVQSDDEFPLMETAVSLAQDEFPGLDIRGKDGFVKLYAVVLRRFLSLVQLTRVLFHFVCRCQSRLIYPGNFCAQFLREL